jgi:hypothetical protein
MKPTLVAALLGTLSLCSLAHAGGLDVVRVQSNGNVVYRGKSGNIGMIGSLHGQAHPVVQDNVRHAHTPVHVNLRTREVRDLGTGQVLGQWHDRADRVQWNDGSLSTRGIYR